MLLVALPAHAEPLVLEWPSRGDSGDWEIEEFEGETRYRVVKLDGRRVLEADSTATASSLYLEREIDIAATPILEWSWRIERPLAVDDERIKDGDDYGRPGLRGGARRGTVRSAPSDQLCMGQPRGGR